MMKANGSPPFSTWQHLVSAYQLTLQGGSGSAQPHESCLDIPQCNVTPPSDTIVYQAFVVSSVA